MNKKHLEHLLYSTGGIVVLLVGLIAVNFLLGAFNARVDLTQGSVYTLSQGTKTMLGKLEAPVTIRFYYSQGSSTVPVGLKTFAKRVEDLLGEYKRASNGKVVIEKLNPEPDSDAEDSAALDGVEGQLTDTQEKFFLGLAVSFLDQKAALPVLAPDREQLLEGGVFKSFNFSNQSTASSDFWICRLHHALQCIPNFDQIFEVYLLKSPVILMMISTRICNR